MERIHTRKIGFEQRLIRDNLIKKCTKELQEMKFYNVTEKAIFIDFLYKTYFKSFLEYHLNINYETDLVINKLLTELE